MLKLKIILTLATSVGVSSTAVGKVTDADLMVASQRVQKVARDASVSGVVVITTREGVEANFALGMANREKKIAHRAGQRWIWASVTKQITAIMIMQEVERGKIKLDDPIGDYLPKFGGDKSTTVRELLQHRSSMPNPSDGDGIDGVQPFYRESGKVISNQGRSEGFCSGPAKRQKGAEFEYNNCDYLVLGAMLEQLEGKSFALLINERIAKPLGLRTLRMAPDRAPRGGAKAIGYDGKLRYPRLNVATFGAAGALTGSASDLAAIDRALMNGKLLSSDAREQMWRGNPQLGYQALGAWSFPGKLSGCSASVALIERRGDVAGTQVRNIIAPDIGRAIVIFTNDGSLDFGEIWQGKGLSYDLLSAAFCPL